jgi:hypothetical protein
MHTQAPPGVTSRDWAGGYDSSDGQTIVLADARALAEALERARDDADRERSWTAVAKSLAIHVRAEFQKITGQELVEPELEATYTCDAEGLQMVIDFLKKGSVVIA